MANEQAVKIDNLTLPLLNRKTKLTKENHTNSGNSTNPGKPKSLSKENKRL